MDSKNMNEIIEDESDVVETGVMDETVEMQARIRLLLEIYPVISPTMLQAGLGPQIPPAKWRPALDKMLESGEVKQDAVYKQSVSGRFRNYSRLGFAKNIELYAVAG